MWYSLKMQKGAVMTRLAFAASCGVCGNTFVGKLGEIMSKVRECEQLGKPAFAFEVGDIVQFRLFHWEVVERRYRRRGYHHVPVYYLRVVKVLTPESWTDRIGPIGHVSWSDEKNLTQIQKGG